MVLITALHRRLNPLLTSTSPHQTQVTLTIHLRKAASLVAHRRQPQPQWRRKRRRANGVSEVVTGMRSFITAKDQGNGRRKKHSTSRSRHQTRTKQGWMISTIIDHLRLFVSLLRIKSLEGEVHQKDPGEGSIIIVSRRFPLR